MEWWWYLIAIIVVAAVVTAIVILTSRKTTETIETKTYTISHFRGIDPVVPVAYLKPSVDTQGKITCEPWKDYWKWNYKAYAQVSYVKDPNHCAFATLNGKLVWHIGTQANLSKFEGLTIK